MNNQFLVSCKNITYKIAGQYILEAINLDITSESITTIIGPNGAGKSTLGKIIAGSLNSGYSGSIKKSKGLKIGYMPQKIHINKLVPISVRDFIFLGVKNLGKTPKSKFDQLVYDNDIKKILLKQLHEISGGEWQRMLLTRMMLQNPDLLILDEPTQGLDINGQRYFYSLIDKICKNEKKGILMISHDLHTVMSSSDNVICLNKHICCSGVPSVVKKSESYKNLFKDSIVLPPYIHDHKH